MTTRTLRFEQTFFTRINAHLGAAEVAQIDRESDWDGRTYYSATLLASGRSQSFLSVAQAKRWIRSQLA